MTYLMALLCVIGISVGQVLFKVGAIAINESGSILSTRVLAPVIGSMAIYALASLLWIHILRKTDLVMIYPLMSLAFVFVPVASYLLFNEKISVSYFIGVAMIAVGITVILRS